MKEDIRDRAYVLNHRGEMISLADSVAEEIRECEDLLHQLIREDSESHAQSIGDLREVIADLKTTAREVSEVIKKLDYHLSYLMNHDDALQVLSIPYNDGLITHVLGDDYYVKTESKFDAQRYRNALFSLGCCVTEVIKEEDGDYAIIIYNFNPETLSKIQQTKVQKPVKEYDLEVRPKPAKKKAKVEPKVKSQEPRFLGRKPKIG